ncbi:MAG: hypothetical protein J6B82_05490 [Bacteroidaceae bacterium]|nr:hypothetical protein [Bacteroidaceae bacterium]
MEELELSLAKIGYHLVQEREKAIKLLKEYIRDFGEIDFSEEEGPETTFYGDGYHVATVSRVLLDDHDDTLIVYAGGEFLCENDDVFTNDTIMDILYSVIGNSNLQ